MSSLLAGFLLEVERHRTLQITVVVHRRTVLQDMPGQKLAAGLAGLCERGRQNCEKS